MPPNPLTPPYEDPNLPYETEHGVRLAIESTAASAISPQESIYVTTPVSSFETSPEVREENINMDGLASSYTSTDEDQDMSDGGGADSSLTLLDSVFPQSLMHTEVPMPLNLAEILSPAMFAAAPFPNSNQASDDTPNDFVDDDTDGPVLSGLLPGVNAVANLPTAMAEVSQQLQHIQNGADELPLNDQAATSAQHSTLPLPLNPPFAPQGTGFVSLAEISVINSSSSVAVGHPSLLGASGLQNAPPWSTVAEAPLSHTSNTTVNEVADSQNLLPNFIIAGWETEADHGEVDEQYNLNLGDFLHHWAASSTHQEVWKKRPKGPSMLAVERHRLATGLEQVRRCDLKGELCDIQRLNWTELGVSRNGARKMRLQTYRNYINVTPRHQLNQSLPHGHDLPDRDNFFKFRSMDFDHQVRLTHFQLRNVMACASRGHVFYAEKSKIIQWNPSTITNANRPKSVAMDLTNPTVAPFHAFPGGVLISTLATAHDILIAGGFCGEYALMNLRVSKDTKQTEGLVTDEDNSITNHIQVHLSRSSSLPVAAFASNDKGFRVLDVNTNRFIAEHHYDYAMNCSAVSPDQRLRVFVGDTKDVMICNSDTGEVLQSLEGHRDFGFACDWADDGWTVATGNQDMQIKIWDARKWTSSSGAASPVTTLAAEMAGVRKLKFSPVGSGKRVLVAAEPADLISIIDAQTFATKQTLSFFGEIGGVDFANDGQDLLVANCDGMRGGILQYERCNLASEATHGLEGLVPRQRSRFQGRSRSYDWISDEEEIVTHPKSKGTVIHRQRKAADLGITIGHF